MLSKEELIARIAVAIGDQILNLNKSHCERAAGAALEALLDSFPDDSKDIEIQARNMQLQCMRDNPTVGTVPSINHYEQQLMYLDKSSEYYKQLLAMRDK